VRGDSFVPHWPETIERPLLHEQTAVRIGGPGRTRTCNQEIMSLLEVTFSDTY